MIRLVKRFRLGRGAFLQWSTTPGRPHTACRGDRCAQGRIACPQAEICQRASLVRPIFVHVLLWVFVACIFIARWPT